MIAPRRQNTLHPEGVKAGGGIAYPQSGPSVAVSDSVPLAYLSGPRSPGARCTHLPGVSRAFRRALARRLRSRLYSLLGSTFPTSRSQMVTIGRSGQSLRDPDRPSSVSDRARVCHARPQRSSLAVACVAVLVALVLPASAGAAQIEVTAQVVATNTAPLPPAGRAGDAISQRWIVRDRHGDVIGDMLIDCRWITAGLRLCIGQLSLPLGVIAVLGASRTRFIGQMAVVGGTGRYVGANGALTFNEIGAGRYVLSITYRKETP